MIFCLFVFVFVFGFAIVFVFVFVLLVLDLVLVLWGCGGSSLVSYLLLRVFVVHSVHVASHRRPNVGYSFECKMFGETNNKSRRVDGDFCAHRIEFCFMSLSGV